MPVLFLSVRLCWKPKKLLSRRVWRREAKRKRRIFLWPTLPEVRPSFHPTHLLTLQLADLQTAERSLGQLPQGMHPYPYWYWVTYWNGYQYRNPDEATKKRFLFSNRLATLALDTHMVPFIGSEASVWDTGCILDT